MGNFKISVNNQLDLEVDTAEVSQLNAVKTSNTAYHVLRNHKSYQAEINNADFNNRTYQVNINNNSYNIKIHNPLDTLIESMGFALGNIKHVNEIKAPMPGLILDISVTVGDSVTENTPLLILEAMKMENVITSPRDGVIKSISAAKGDAVEKNQLLIEFE
ncbi:acetyl-CoA carboxylase biotin carboxyl carrier protein subunit [Mangrovimonas sp. DI 80]|uniref:acetyl-CoA carboxylase biotin carboxyl carrier protein subunit n=1 Tax=Mangrovimonas sp. DI 80 TaxID=1779330 RepID=UPI000975E90E|nr:acetyl-CoA carboxylase biotin carboxyl carrier protein subunit [Mangrovimonas sp. DI 80]OMP30851.1 acetyl-CoA carboxylase biotin carboxyl carrier protein subunit [Mangrovimonas sp. DI 80]